MIKQHLKMEQFNSRWLAATLGIIGGMTKYIHMLVTGNILLINITIQPLIMAALSAVAGLIAKDLYKWAKIPFLLHIKPWLKSLFNKKRKS